MEALQGNFIFEFAVILLPDEGHDFSLSHLISLQHIYFPLTGQLPGLWKLGLAIGLGLRHADICILQRCKLVCSLSQMPQSVKKCGIIPTLSMVILSTCYVVVVTYSNNTSQGYIGQLKRMEAGESFQTSHLVWLPEILEVII
jgi:hypothetical protein